MEENQNVSNRMPSTSNVNQDLNHLSNAINMDKDQSESDSIPLTCNANQSQSHSSNLIISKSNLNLIINIVRSE